MLVFSKKRGMLMKHTFIKVMLIIDAIICFCLSVILFFKAEESVLFFAFACAAFLNVFFFLGLYMFIQDVENHIKDKDN